VARSAAEAHPPRTAAAKVASGAHDAYGIVEGLRLVPGRCPRIGQPYVVRGSSHVDVSGRRAVAGPGLRAVPPIVCIRKAFIQRQALHGCARVRD
jgi:hypothetical protein